MNYKEVYLQALTMNYKEVYLQTLTMNYKKVYLQTLTMNYKKVYLQTLTMNYKKGYFQALTMNYKRGYFQALTMNYKKVYLQALTMNYKEVHFQTLTMNYKEVHFQALTMNYKKVYLQTLTMNYKKGYFQALTMNYKEVYLQALTMNYKEVHFQALTLNYKEGYFQALTMNYKKVYLQALTMNYKKVYLQTLTMNYKKVYLQTLTMNYKKVYLQTLTMNYKKVYLQTLTMNYKEVYFQALTMNYKEVYFQALTLNYKKGYFQALTMNNKEVPHQALTMNYKEVYLQALTMNYKEVYLQALTMNYKEVYLQALTMNYKEVYLQALTMNYEEVHFQTLTMNYKEVHFQALTINYKEVPHQALTMNYKEVPHKALTMRPVSYYYTNLLAFFYTVDEINEDPSILPNLTLGYHIYDSCSDPRKAIKSVLQILSGPGHIVPNYSCTRKKKKVVGFIGDHYSWTTLPIAQILGIYPYSQISYGATDTLLNDRRLFPWVFRTFPDDHTTYSAISHFLSHFDWTWVGIISSDDDAGEKETRLLTNLLTSRGICVAYVLKVGIKVAMDQGRALSNTQKGKSTPVVPVRLYVLKDSAVEAVLSKRVGDKMQLHPCAFLSHKMSSAHGNYDIGNKELLVIKVAFSEWRHLLEGANHSVHNYLQAIMCPDKSGLQRKCFTNNGDIKPGYIILNVLAMNGTLIVNKIGQYKLDSTGALDFWVNVERVKWKNKKNEIPRSQCSASCSPGHRKVTTSSIHLCCYDCIPCSEGEISNVSDSENCRKCPEDAWSNENRTLCVMKEMEYLSYTEDILSIAFSSLATFFWILTLLILLSFVSQRDTAIVRANNKNLSFVLLVSIMLSFLSVFLFLGRPVDTTCRLRQISTGILLSISISSLLAKTIMVYMAFRATKPGSVWSRWSGVTLPNCVLLICSSVQGVICMSWVTLSPPFQELDTHSYKEKMVVQCNEGSDLCFYSVLGYMGILAAVSFITAFLARTLPDSFNEAKYITFSMLVFCSVWIAMIPAYLSTKGKYMVAVEIFAILTSNAGLLGCIFFPKCYIILFKPELNTRKHILGSKDTMLHR
ncbi:vomeronasal type-2 receptor 26-like [Dendropsophus ebraccatus]|uniref:vomeronasal type-2 receptor 26-like n=1 Tax=Dendropsophus ebraccatus TaxID=150705 RepID=UPI003832322F